MYYAGTRCIYVRNKTVAISSRKQMYSKFRQKPCSVLNSEGGDSPAMLWSSLKLLLQKQTKFPRN